MVKKSFVVFDIDDDKTDLPTLCSKVEKNIYQSATSLSFSIDHKTMTSSSTGCGHLALIVC